MRVPEGSRPAGEPADSTPESSPSVEPARELLSAADVGRTIARIAHQIIEKTALDAADGDAPRVVLIGIPPAATTLADRLAGQGRRILRGAARRSAPSTSPSTATTCAPSRTARSNARRRPRAGSTTPWWSSSTTCCSPAGPSARRSTRSATSGGRAPFSWRSSSTAATANCRCAPTTSARTCPPPAPRTSRCC